MKKIITIVLAVVMAVTMLAGCGIGGNTADGKVKIKIGEWPNKDTEPEKYESWMKIKADFEAENPEVEIVPDTYKFDVKTFTAKAAAKQLPNHMRLPFTEVENIIKSKYSLNLTDKLKEIGWYEYINPALHDIMTDDKGDYYVLPSMAYTFGLAINKKVFEEAGLVNDDGSVMLPETLEDIAKYGQQINEKTGKIGLAMPTMDNCGGWMFMPIAWDYGVEFMEESSDGKWEATFDSQEMRDALNFYKDLKWKYHAISNSTVISNDERMKMYATGQAGMMFGDLSGVDALVKNYGMDKNDIIFTSMPKGPKGAYTLLGGAVIMVSANTTPEQLDALFKWYKFTGTDPSQITDDELKVFEENLALNIEQGKLVFEKDVFPSYINDEVEAKKQPIRDKYVNVDMKNFENYYSFENVELHPEEPKCCQQLYAVLDGCIQEILSNENADIDALVKKANQDFQVNHLDKE